MTQSPVTDPVASQKDRREIAPEDADFRPPAGLGSQNPPVMTTLPPPPLSTDPASTTASARRTSSLPPPIPDEVDAAHFAALRDAGLCADLTDGLLMVLQERVGPKEEDARRLDLLEHYYDANGDPAMSDKRWSDDRMVLFRDENGATARTIVAALAHSHPETGDTHIERLGGSDGPLVLRCGEHMSAVDDEDVTGGGRTVAVRSLVTAFNVLLDRFADPRRLVPLRGDGRREMYVALDVEHAVPLCLGGHLEEMTTSELMSLAAW